jgi:hypothetical protein
MKLKLLPSNTIITCSQYAPYIGEMFVEIMDDEALVKKLGTRRLHLKAGQYEIVEE